MVRRWISHWEDRLVNPQPRKPLHQSGQAARFFDIWFSRAVIFLIAMLIWLRLGFGLYLSITASLFTMGFAARFSRSPRRVRLFLRGSDFLKRLRGYPESRAFNHRFWAMLGVGFFLLAIAFFRGGAWGLYWGVLGGINILLSLLVLRYRWRTPVGVG